MSTKPSIEAIIEDVEDVESMYETEELKDTVVAALRAIGTKLTRIEGRLGAIEMRLNAKKRGRPMARQDQAEQDAQKWTVRLLKQRQDDAARAVNLAPRVLALVKANPGIYAGAMQGVLAVNRATLNTAIGILADAKEIVSYPGFRNTIHWKVASLEESPRPPEFDWPSRARGQQEPAEVRPRPTPVTPPTTKTGYAPANSAEEKIISYMRSAGKPVTPGDLREAIRIDGGELADAIADLKIKGAIVRTGPSSMILTEPGVK